MDSPLLSPPLSASPEKKSVSRRSFFDPAATRSAIYSKVLSAGQSLKPVTNGRHTLEIADVSYREKDYDSDFSPDQQREAILGGKSLGRRLAGNVRLIDNTTGKVLDERRQTLAVIPHLTNRGTFIQNGNQMSLRNQMRLRPGVYTRVKDNGELESFVNALPGRGFGHRYSLDPAKGVFYAHIHQAKIPLMPLLRQMGVRDEQLKAAWGSTIYAANAQKNDPRDLDKYIKKVLKERQRTGDREKDLAAVVEAVRNIELDPEVSGRTLGAPYKNLDLPAILAATGKLARVNRGEADPDDRDDLANQQVVGPEDLFSERLARDAGYVRQQLLRKASWKNNLSSVPPGALTKQVQAALHGSGLGELLQQVNAAEVLGKQGTMTRLGEGGIGSTQAIPDESRNNQASYMSFIDAVLTPESNRVGVDLSLARGAMKGDDGRIYAPFKNTRTGEMEYLSPQQLSQVAVAFRGEMARKGSRAHAIRGGKIQSVRKSEVDYEADAFENAYSPLSNLIPLKSASAGHRVSMGARMTAQALPLFKAEAPLVQTGVPGQPGQSFEGLYGEALGAVRARGPGRVVREDNKEILVRYADGTEDKKQLYRNLPFNRKTGLTQTSLVKAGQEVAPGQVLARSNYTNDTGEAALGVNARVGLLSFRGANFEDAIVVSESFAERMAADHLYQNKFEPLPSHKPGRAAFLGLFPDKFERKQIDKLDASGVVKVGQTVEEGDPLIVAAQAADRAKNRVHKKGQREFRDASLTWNHHSPGEVTDVVRSDKGINVVVKAKNPAGVGFKLANRYGGKGVTSQIIPDEQMPRDASGEPLEVLLNPHGTISRLNLSQIHETVLAKIAAKTGKPYRIVDFEDIEDLDAFVEREMEKHGVKALEDVVDPITGRKIPNVLVGRQFMMRLHHDPEDKAQGRSFGAYTQNDAPAKGGGDSQKSKRMGLLDMMALLSHDAGEVLRDATQLRGQKNEDYWLAYMQGYDPKPPKVPFVYEKFVNTMKAAGVNVVGEGPRQHLMAMTDKDVKQLAGDREVEVGETVNFDDELKPVTGGLFDNRLTGGHGGDRWSKISLPEPMLNPVFEEPARRLLGLTKPAFEEVLRGQRELPNGQTGMSGVGEMLSGIDVDKRLAQERLTFSTTRGARRDAAARNIGYLKTLSRIGHTPGDWMLSAVPVLPPKYRPVSMMQGSNTPLAADANFLYRELIESRDNLRELAERVDDVGEERLGLYKAMQALSGTVKPESRELQQRRVKGLLKQVFGNSAKLGSVQRHLLSTTTDLVGRGVIVPEPDYDTDTIGIPEKTAWEVYYPHVVRRLRRRGMDLAEAVRQTREQTEAAKKELVAEMDDRPIVVNRAPVLHKYGILALKPRLVSGSVIKLSPLIYKGYGADNDGDTMQFHVMGGEEARKEALRKMLPSQNLVSPADFNSSVPTLTQEYVMGLHEATRGPGKGRRPRRFTNEQAALQAYLSGQMPYDTPIDLD